MCYGATSAVWGGSLGECQDRLEGQHIWSEIGEGCVDDMSIQSSWIKESTTQNPYKLVLKVVCFL